MTNAPAPVMCPDCGMALKVDEWGYSCKSCGYRQRHQPDPKRTICPIDGTELTNDIKLFPGATDYDVMTWHRLHYHDYLTVKEGGRFCPKITCLWTEPQA